ncbi:TadE/TadG family type IV pilus assembly protein [Actinomadura parmotrematis]|uniref:Pilus assembly protein n=1 Tax=Actinomadura parmotrematis TaxID=2864039 RepID=A0ABS7FXA2_9ACTN|nr:TadE family protein [Actinomadura parmotrematis]MBW8484951.1 pilus assembly protein [Actinomadura parmotrematis]
MTTPRPPGARRGGDRGAAAVEFAAVLPVALFLMLIAYQGYIASTTVERVENIARTGARQASQHYDAGRCRAYAMTARPRWINDYRIQGGAARVSGEDAVYCRVDAKLPLLWKGVPLDVKVSRTVTMPLG